MADIWIVVQSKDCINFMLLEMHTESKLELLMYGSREGVRLPVSGEIST